MARKRPLKTERFRYTTENQRGFTFAEMLAAMLFMAIVIPVAVEGLIVANRSGVAAYRTRIAAQLADRLLTELIVTDEWRYADNSGTFGEMWPEYQWILENEEWGEDSLRLVTVVVLFGVQDREYNVSLSALVDETIPEETEEETEEET